MLSIGPENTKGKGKKLTKNHVPYVRGLSIWHPLRNKRGVPTHPARRGHLPSIQQRGGTWIPLSANTGGRRTGYYYRMEYKEADWMAAWQLKYLRMRRRDENRMRKYRNAR
jgi:hypothetical protein